MDTEPLDNESEYSVARLVPVLHLPSINLMLS